MKCVLKLKGNLIHVHTPYHAEYIQDLKTQIPHGGRIWDKDLRIWIVNKGFEKILLKIVYKHFDEVEYSQDGEPQQQKQAISELYATLHLLSTAPEELIKAAYKALSKIHHPDVGGDLVKMQEINAAYDAIRKDRHIA